MDTYGLERSAWLELARHVVRKAWPWASLEWDTVPLKPWDLRERTYRLA